jgi:hypothetical protein
VIPGYDPRAIAYGAQQSRAVYGCLRAGQGEVTDPVDVRNHVERGHGVREEVVDLGMAGFDVPAIAEAA